MCTVLNLITGEKQIYTCPPEQAVIAAFAQSRGDYNTWEYDAKYSWILDGGEECVWCDNFSAFRDGRDF